MALAIMLMWMLAAGGPPCGKCHADLLQAKVVHEAAEDCETCHEDQGNHTYPDLGDEEVVEMCTTCHDDVNPTHPPEDALCTNCHDPHASSHRRLLVDPVPELCADCHDLPGTVLVEHSPFADGECLDCHTPHGSPNPSNLVESLPDLCLECHDEIGEEISRDYVHPPAEDECTDCHRPHGSDFQKLLKGFMTLRFYERYAPLKYQLCFQCHEREEVFGPDSGFRRGERNLHQVHVARAKGRTCRVCHEVHGSDQEHLLRTRLTFGPYWTFPLEVRETDQGKSCRPACHQEEAYGR